MNLVSKSQVRLGQESEKRTQAVIEPRESRHFILFALQWFFLDVREWSFGGLAGVGQLGRRSGAVGAGR